MYYSINNNELSIADKKENLTAYFENVQELPSDYEVGKYIVQDNELALNPNWEEEKNQAEKERIAKLYLTGADVERGIYQAKGMDFEDILTMVETLKQVQGDSFNIDIKALKIELKANNFYRGNPYVEYIGTLLGFKSEQLDKFFEDGNYEHLLV